MTYYLMNNYVQHQSPTVHQIYAPPAKVQTTNNNLRRPVALTSLSPQYVTLRPVLAKINKNQRYQPLHKVVVQNDERFVPSLQYDPKKSNQLAQDTDYFLPIRYNEPKDYDDYTDRPT